MKDSLHAFILVGLITCLTMLPLIISSYAIKNQVHYAHGTVVQTGLDDGSIEVKIEDSGFRVFVHDLGPYNQFDFQFEDEVDLQLSNNQYHITNIQRE